MPTVENTSEETRVWPSLQTIAGTTLELGPHDTAEVVSLPEGFEDPVLKVVKPKPEPPKPAESPKKPEQGKEVAP